MINRTLLFMMTWTAIGVVGAPLVYVFLNTSMLLSFSFGWFGVIAVILVRSMFATQHQQLSVLREQSRRQVHRSRFDSQVTAASKAQVSVLQNLKAQSRKIDKLEQRSSEAFGEQSRTLHNAGQAITQLSNRLLAIELNQELLEDIVQDKLSDNAGVSRDKSV